MRCELAASLLHSPKILFLDEPTIGLDAVSKLAVRKFIKTINKEQNVTVILTTHDMSDIESLTERTILIGNGKKLYDGSFQHLRETYSVIRKLEIVYDSDNQNRLPHFITIESNSENLCQLTYDIREVNLSGCIELLSRRFNITDLRLRDEPTEHIIAKIYEDYKL